jgi:hypothetical protein
MLGFFPLFLASFSLILAVYGIGRARREREVLHLVVTVCCLLGALAAVAMFFDQPLLGFLFSVPAVPVVVVAWFKGSKLREREYAKMLEEVNASTPLRASDFLSWRAWLIMVLRWGVRKNGSPLLSVRCSYRWGSTLRYKLVSAFS